VVGLLGRTSNSRKEGHEDQGVSSNRPELVGLAECLEDHGEHVSLLYKKIIIKLQKKFQAGTTTLLIKVKDHRGDPLNEEADIRTEMGHHKEEKEVGWNNPTNRTIYKKQEKSKNFEY
jgi:hypothetical protein